MEIHNPYDQECLVTVLIIRRGVIIETTMIVKETTFAHWSGQEWDPCALDKLPHFIMSTGIGNAFSNDNEWAFSLLK